MSPVGWRGRWLVADTAVSRWCPLTGEGWPWLCIYSKSGEVVKLKERSDEMDPPVMARIGLFSNVNGVDRVLETIELGRRHSIRKLRPNPRFGIGGF